MARPSPLSTTCGEGEFQVVWCFLPFIAGVIKEGDVSERTRRSILLPHLRSNPGTAPSLRSDRVELPLAVSFGSRP
jgi:hypothetical protein